MIAFMRSLFGLNSSSGKRKVVGNALAIEAKDVGQLQASNTRLSDLHQLYSRYRGTPHAHKIKMVYDKTKTIHDYLISRNRVYELALFHIQHTEHFLSTFSTILDVHLGHPAASAGARTAEAAPAMPNQLTREERNRQKEKSYPKLEMVRPPAGQMVMGKQQEGGVPHLSVPEIIISTYATIPYVKEEVANGKIIHQIGYASTPREKEAFLQYLAASLSFHDFSYAGNALMSMPNSNGTQSSGMVPVIHWAGYLYAVNLNDYRLFPVKMYRKSS